jgi:predicted outer membrane repeat protein
MYNEGLSSAEVARPSMFEGYFYNNLAGGADASGGGMYNYNYAQPSLERVTFEGNRAAYGGGVDTEYQSHVEMKNVTFARNQASEQGGAIYGWQSYVALTNATFAENMAPSDNGKDIFQESGTLTLRNTILGSGCDQGDDAIVSASYSLFQNSSNACGIGDGINGNRVGVDPGLDVFGYHGGFTPLFTLQKDSAAIDSGSNSGCPPSDQRGFKRPVQGKAGGSLTCDIGALEFYPYAVFLPLILR